MIQCISVILLFFSLVSNRQPDSLQIYHKLSLSERNSGNYTKSVNYLKHAQSHCTSYKDSIKIYNTLATLHYRLTDYYTAITFLNKALALSRVNNYNFYEGYIYINYGLNYTDLLLFDEALNYFNKAFKYVPDNIHAALYHNIGRVHKYSNNLDSAEYYLKLAYEIKLKELGYNNASTITSALELAEITKDKTILSTIQPYIESMHNDYYLSWFYYLLGEYDKAISYNREDKRISLEIYTVTEQWEAAIKIIDTLRTGYLDIDSKLFLQANERLIYKNAVQEALKTDTLKAYQLALKSRANVLQEEIGFKPSPNLINSHNYFDFDSIIYLFVVNNKVINTYKIEANETFSQHYNNLRKCFIPDTFKSAYQEYYRTFCRSSKYLYETLVPEYGERMNIIPDGRVQFIPFEVLLTAAPSDTNHPDYSILPYLMNKAVIKYDYLPREYKRSKDRKKIVGIAPFKELGYTSKGVRFLRRYNSRAYIGKRATKDKIYKGDILQISTHYDYINNYIKLNHDTLYLDSINNLPKDLVILNTCFSGYGEEYSGEGVFSPARAFYKAGAKSVVESAWITSDVSSHKILKLFHKNVKKGYDKAQALKKAKIEYLALPFSHDHPFYWAGLRVFGNSHPLKYGGLIFYFILLAIAVVLIKYFSRLH